MHMALTLIFRVEPESSGQATPNARYVRTRGYICPHLQHDHKKEKRMPPYIFAFFSRPSGQKLRRRYRKQFRHPQTIFEEKVLTNSGRLLARQNTRRIVPESPTRRKNRSFLESSSLKNEKKKGIAPPIPESPSRAACPDSAARSSDGLGTPLQRRDSRHRDRLFCHSQCLLGLRQL